MVLTGILIILDLLLPFLIFQILNNNNVVLFGGILQPLEHIENIKKGAKRDIELEKRMKERAKDFICILFVEKKFSFLDNLLNVLDESTAKSSQ